MQRSRFLTLITTGSIAAGLVATACLSQGPVERVDAEPELELAELGEMTHVSVCGDVWMGSGASSGDLGIASRRGVETVIDLSDRSDELDVEAVVTELGLEYLRADFSLEGSDSSEIDRVLVVLGRPDRGSVLLLCGDGSRSSILFAIHRVYNDGLTIEEALEEARRAGLKPGTGEQIVLGQLARLGITPPEA